MRITERPLNIKVFCISPGGEIDGVGVGVVGIVGRGVGEGVIVGVGVLVGVSVLVGLIVGVIDGVIVFVGVLVGVGRIKGLKKLGKIGLLQQLSTFMTLNM